MRIFHPANYHVRNMLRKEKRNKHNWALQMIIKCGEKFSSVVLCASSSLLQRQAVLLLQTWEQRQSNLSVLKDSVTVRKCERARYHMMKLRYVHSLIQKPRRKKT